MTGVLFWIFDFFMNWLGYIFNYYFWNSDEYFERCVFGLPLLFNVLISSIVSLSASSSFMMLGLCSAVPPNLESFGFVSEDWSLLMRTEIGSFTCFESDSLYDDSWKAWLLLRMRSDYFDCIIFAFVKGCPPAPWSSSSSVTTFCVSSSTSSIYEIIWPAFRLLLRWNELNVYRDGIIFYLVGDMLMFLLVVSSW